ncbi:TetR family transcriptional regulator [Nocardioides marinquilinus]|uniref:TetR family transcriptional regulator n=1 Tax=Nocardioides marinquilinus TaxID=1210400 RepID=A0ABP9PQK3_9ACTN
MTDTRTKLLAATTESLRHDGIAGLSARGVAARAGVNQALVFYHFGSVGELVQAAVRTSVDASVGSYRARFDEIGSLAELLTVGRELHERERALGNVAVMAQLMAGAQQDLTLAEAARYAMARWNDQIEDVVRRVLGDNPLGDLVDPGRLAQAISAVFIGLELYDGVDPVGSSAAIEALETLVAMLQVAAELGPVSSRALRAKLRQVSARAAG